METVTKPWPDDRMDAFEERVDRRFAEIDRRFGEVDRRFDEVDRRFVQVEASLARVEDTQATLVRGMIAQMTMTFAGFIGLGTIVIAFS